MESDDLKAANTEEQPDRVKPHTNGSAVVDGAKVTASCTKASWNVIRLKV